MRGEHEAQPAAPLSHERLEEPRAREWHGSRGNAGSSVGPIAHGCSSVGCAGRWRCWTGA